MSFIGNDGHRQRLRERFLKAGRNGLCCHELLELLLCYAIPRRDVKPLAKALLEKYGDFISIIKAAPEKLMQTSGIGENSAVLLNLVGTICLEIFSKPVFDGSFARCPEMLYSYLMMKLAASENEVMHIILLDKDFRMIDSFDINGSAGMIQLPEKLIRQKISCYPSVTQVIVAHNHPGNKPSPSPADINSTLVLKSILQKMQISLLDHIIVCDNGCVSLMKIASLKHV